jgi:DNA-binding NarL/FixJ family response regulator
LRGPSLTKRSDAGPRKPRGACISVRAALSPRDLECLDLCSQGVKDKAIAARLGISWGTVKVYFFHMFKKTDCKTRCELVARYVREGS